MLELTLVLHLTALRLLLVLQMTTFQVLLQLHDQGLQPRFILVHDLQFLLDIMVDALFMGDHGFRLTEQISHRILPLGVHAELHMIGMLTYLGFQ